MHQRHVSNLYNRYESFKKECFGHVAMRQCVDDRHGTGMACQL